MPEGEFDWVELKGRKALDVTAPGVVEGKVLEELAKQVSAFANSGGGVLVYGISNPSDHKPKTVDDGGNAIGCKRPNIREWQEDVIPNMVEFPLRKFNVYALTKQKGAPSIPDDRCIILVDIPGSDDAPHQSAKDHLYYARIGGKSRPIGHRLVADIFHRRTHPVISVGCSIKSETWVPKPLLDIPAVMKPEPVREVKLHVTVTNTGQIYAKHLHINVMVPKVIMPREDRRNAGEDYCHKALDNRRRDVIGHDPTFGSPIYGVPWLDPLLPSESRTWDIRCSSRLIPETLKSLTLRWLLNADNAAPVSGEVKLWEVKFEVLDKHAMHDLGPDPYI